MPLVTLDMGNSRGKTNAGIEFSTKILEIDKNKAQFSEFIIIDETCFAISQGNYDHNNVKPEKETYEHFTLYAIACSTNDNSVNLLLNLPINQLPMKQILIDKFKNKTFTFKVNSNVNKIKLHERKIAIKNVEVVGEGISAYYSLDEELDNFISMLDIGSKNINYATYTEIGQLNLAKSGTLDFGLHDFYNDVIVYFKEKQGKTYTIADIDERVRNDKIEIPLGLKTKFVKKIQNELLGRGFFDFQDYAFKAIGGGSLVLKFELMQLFDNLVVLPDAIFRNVRGLELIGESLEFDKDTNKLIRTS